MRSSHCVAVGALRSIESERKEAGAEDIWISVSSTVAPASNSALCEALYKKRCTHEIRTETDTACNHS